MGWQSAEAEADEALFGTNFFAVDARFFVVDPLCLFGVCASPALASATRRCFARSAVASRNNSSSPPLPPTPPPPLPSLAEASAAFGKGTSARSACAEVLVRTKSKAESAAAAFEIVIR